MVVSAIAPGEGRYPNSRLSKQDLSARRGEFLELMQGLNFGRIEGLAVHDGEPVVNPRPTVVREHKFDSENGARPELGITDFLLKKQVVELFEYFDELQDGVVDVLEIKHGLPFRMIVTEVPA